MSLAASTTRTRRATTLSLLALVAGCSESPTATADRHGSAPATFSRDASPSQADALSQVARAFALALGDPSIRVLVKDAFRASPYVLHALDLHEFVRTPAGTRVLTVGAQQSGVSAARLAAPVAALPALDLVVPRIQDRRTWDGTGPAVVVASLVRNTQRALAYTPDGAANSYGVQDAASGPVLIALHPSGSHGQRMDPQPAGAGRTIQDAKDGTWSMTHIAISAKGDSAVTRFTSRAQVRRFNAAMSAGTSAPRGAVSRPVLALAGGMSGGSTPNMIACGDPGADPSCDVNPSPPSTSTYIQNVLVIDSCQDKFLGNCVNSDLVWQAHQTGYATPAYYIKLDGWGYNEERDNMNVFFFPQIPAQSPMLVTLNEGDGHLYGSYTLNGNNTPTLGGLPVAGTTTWLSAGEDRCGNEGHVCNGIVYWREVNTIYRIQP